MGISLAAVSNESWDVLIPTIRKPGSEIWLTFNPNQETDPTYVRFVKNEPAAPGEFPRVEISWRDNPWFPEELRREMAHMRRVDYDAYLHVWEGHCRNVSDAQVLKGKIAVEDFVPNAPETGEWHGPYYGADWGFAQDPSTVVKLWINGMTLYVEHEAYGVGVDNDELPGMWATVAAAGLDQCGVRLACIHARKLAYASGRERLEIDAPTAPTQAHRSTGAAGAEHRSRHRGG